MTEFWEDVFADKKLMWGREPTQSALFAGDYFGERGVKDVLIPGIGYGRNAKPFLDREMNVTGIEISETAIALARSDLGLTFPIHHGSVTAMPYDDHLYGGIFCYGLLYLLDAAGRAKVIADCERQLKPGGHMIFTLISKKAPMYGQGSKLGEDWYERLPNLPMYFYDAASVLREFGAHGLIDTREVEEPMHGSAPMPFLHAICRK